MIGKVLNRINKKQVKYKTYGVNNKSKDLIETTLSSSLLREGNVSYKIFVNNGVVEQYLTLPVQIHLPTNKMEYTPMDHNLNMYQLQLNNNNFFTLNILSQRHILDIVHEVAEFTGEDEYLVFNLILKPKQKLNGLFTEQYKQFANGVKNPSSNKLVNVIQNHFMENDKLYFPMDMIDLIEHKISDLHFEFQLFVGLSYKSQQKEDLILNIIEDTLDDFSHLNHFTIEPIEDNGCEAINNYEFLYQYSKQYISYSEISTLFFNDTEVELTHEYEQVETIPDEQDIQITQPMELNQQPILQPSSTYALDTLPSLELLPVQVETNDEDVDQDIPERIKKALKRVGIVKSQQVHILDFKQGATLIKVTTNIPNDKNLSDITKKRDDIQAALGLHSLSIEQGDQPESVSFFLPREKRQPIYLRYLLENDDFIKFAEKHPLPFVTGVDPIGNPIYSCLSKLKHLLTAGQTGGGKSVWLNQLILTLLMLRKPNEMMMYLIDPKKVEFTQFNDFPQVVKVETDMQEANKLLESLIVEMENRYDKLAPTGYKDIGAYNKHNEDKIPYIVCVVDEFADLKMVNPNVEESIARLGQKARGAGIHLIVATQRPDAKIIDGTIKSNLPSKISFRLDNNKHYTTVFGTGIPYQLLGNGHGAMKLEGQIKEFEQFQGAVISIHADEEIETYQNIKRSFKGEKVEGIKVEKPEPKEEPIIKLKKIIAETGEVRIGKLRELMGIRNNVVKDLMQQLKEEGWLIQEEEGSKYELNEECEELIKLRQFYEMETGIVN